MDIESIKESILEEMPTRPVKKVEFVDRYGVRVDSALRQLIETKDLVRVKRGMYSLSDDRLDNYNYTKRENDKVFIPTREVSLLIRSFYSNFSIECLLKENQGVNLEEIGYFKQHEVSSSREYYKEKKEVFLYYMNQYKVSKEEKDWLNYL